MKAQLVYYNKLELLLIVLSVKLYYTLEVNTYYCEYYFEC